VIPDHTENFVHKIFPYVKKVVKKSKLYTDNKPL